MIHVLVVASKEDLAEPEAGRSAIEVLHAHGADEAVEKLGRNRRIDAVLLLAGAENEAIAAAIREDSLAPPPFYLPASASDLVGARRLSSDLPRELLDLVARALASA